MVWVGSDFEDHLVLTSLPETDTFHQPRVLKAPSNLALNAAREGAATASLGNLGQGLLTFTVKNFFLISNLNLSSYSLKPSPPILSLHAPVKSPSPALHMNMYVESLNLLAVISTTENCNPPQALAAISLPSAVSHFSPLASNFLKGLFVFQFPDEELLC